VDIGRLQPERKRVVRTFLDESITEEEYRRRLVEIDSQIRTAQPVVQAGIEDAAALLSDLPALWPEATSGERQQLIAPLIERSYIDVEYRCIAAIAPTPAFRSLLKNALNHLAQPTCVLVEATDEIDWAQWWTWWRRGRRRLSLPQLSSRR
jgi:hypothetical protein